MRKLFMGTILISLLGALVIGAVLAWTGSTPALPRSATAGNVVVAVNWDSGGTGNKVVPTNAWIEVAKAGITNTGDIDVHVQANPNAGSVGSIGYSPSCGGSDNTTGQVIRTSNANVPTGTSVADLVSVQLKADTGLEDACQGATVNYDLTINVES